MHKWKTWFSTLRAHRGGVNTASEAVSGHVGAFKVSSISSDATTLQIYHFHNSPPNKQSHLYFGFLVSNSKKAAPTIKTVHEYFVCFRFKKERSVRTHRTVCVCAASIPARPFSSNNYFTHFTSSSRVLHLHSIGPEWFSGWLGC